MKNIDIYHEGWVADCALCGNTIRSARTRKALEHRLVERRDEHLRDECGAIDHQPTKGET